MSKHQRDLLRQYFAFDIRFMSDGSVMRRNGGTGWTRLLSASDTKRFLRTLEVLSPARR